MGELLDPVSDQPWRRVPSILSALGLGLTH